MADPRRLETPSGEAADRDSRAEALLVEGLDQYFAGRYDDAIHLWTRVLFLNRSHARARAYIDRARTAMAERQRRAEEMLQATDALVTEGKTVAARELLNRAVAATGDDDRSADVRARLERMERARADVAAGPGRAVMDAVPVPRAARRWRVLTVASAVTAGAIVLAAIGMVGVRRWYGAGAPGSALPTVTRAPALPVLSTSEAALVRARTLYSRGRLADALRALDRVDADGTNRVEANRLKTAIQQLLLATGRGASFTGDLDRGRP